MELKYAALQYGEYKGSKDSRLKDRVTVIEEAARAADPEIAQYILKNVTERVRYEEMQVPAGMRQFFAARQRFFVELHARMQ